MKFTKIYGQDAVKLGLILNVIDPTIGGVLLLGDRGTGKSTSVRALRSFLPNQFFLKGKTWVERPTPLVELPLGATEDRLCGTIDLEKALQKGEKSFEPGLLAKAHGGLLYVDEINLLDDHLIDLLLDSAASGWNTVERETISVKHPANFILIGSGNPEEGELRPQLLDRFGLNVFVKTPQSIKLRAQITKTVLEGDKETKQDKLEDIVLFSKIREAKKKKVQIKKEFQNLIAQICAELQIDGLRGDLTLIRTSKALAAWRGRNFVELEDIRTVLPFCLCHRLRKNPLDKMDSNTKVIETFDKLVQRNIV